jgi:2-oxoglutarate ferredoxin oxidoreductase subunit delta
VAAKGTFRVVIDGECCDGCGVCIFYCKPVVIELSRTLNRRGFYPAVAVRHEGCTNCQLCEVACPQLSIAVVPGGGAP